MYYSFTHTWPLAITMSSVPKESWEKDDEEPSQEQIDILENNFNKVSRQPDKCLLMLIAAEAGLTDKATAVRKYIGGGSSRTVYTLLLHSFARRLV